VIVPLRIVSITAGGGGGRVTSSSLSQEKIAAVNVIRMTENFKCFIKLIDRSLKKNTEV
jgi:hypothetical protein